MVRLSKVKFKSKTCVSTLKSLDFIHLDLWTRSLEEKFYRFNIVNDYYRFTLTLFLTSKEEIFKFFVKFNELNQNQNQFNFKIVTLRRDYGGEFVNNHHFESNENKFLINSHVRASPQ